MKEDRNYAELIYDYLIEEGTNLYDRLTFCYGPTSCKFYKMGRPRSVPYKNRYTAIDDGYASHYKCKDIFLVYPVYKYKAKLEEPITIKLKFLMKKLI